MRKTVSLLLAMVLCFGLASPALAADPTFSDVPAAYWGYEAIEAMAAKGVISGLGDGLYGPENQLTNVQFAVMLVRLFYPDQKAADGSGSLWWSGNMRVAYGLGLLAGTPAGDAYAQAEAAGRDPDYAPFDVPMPRAEMAQVIYNYLSGRGQLPPEADTQAARSRIPDYASLPARYQQAVAAVYASGYLSGVDSAGRFDGDGTLTRAQAAMVLYRLSGGGDGTPDSEQEKAPDPPETTSPAPTLANGKAITDDNIREIIYGLKDSYPEGMPWTNENGYQSKALWTIGGGCEAFGLICSDAAFGDLPVSSRHSNFDEIKVGDLLRVNNNTHTVIVLEKRQDSVVVAEGNYNYSIHWGREISRKSLEDGNFSVRSRYPA